MRSFSSLLSALVISTSLVVAATGCAVTGSDDDYSATEGEAANAGKVDLWQATDGQWHFHLKSGNGSILLTSEAYTSRTGAINGLLSTFDNGVDPIQYKVVAATHGYVIHLVAGNNAIISFSEVYASKSNANRAVTSCVKAVTSYLDKRETLSTGARVEIRRGATGQFSFGFFAKNGQQVLSSESYTTTAAAYNGAFAVQAVGTTSAAYALLQARDGSWYFTVSAQNGQIVGVSETYTTRQSAQAAEASLQTLLPTINVL